MITCTFEDGGTGKLRHVTVTLFLFNKDKTKTLLAQRSGKYSEPFKWGPPGGYLSRDETTYEAALREAFEETGHKATITTLLRIADNADRPKEDRQNVDFLYVGEAEEQGGEHDHEIAAVKWFDLENLPLEEEFAFDHYENLQICLAYFKQSFPVPVIGKVVI